MTSFNLLSRRLIAGLALASFVHASPATAESAMAERVLAGVVEELEATLDARIGVLIRDSGSDWELGHREDERFLMASTFKSILCGAVLDRVDHGELDLAEELPVRQDDILKYAPVAKEHVGEALGVADLCLATLDLSDNTAANMLIDRLGGPQEVTSFLRDIGDEVTRLDRKEPGLNIFAPGDPRDTTSPSAMLSSWEAMLLGDALEPQSREQLHGWMSHGGVTGALLRASTPEDWTVADKSGAGDGYTRNLVAMVTPPGRAPFFVAIFVSDTPTDFATRNDAVAKIGEAIVDVLKAR